METKQEQNLKTETEHPLLGNEAIYAALQSKSRLIDNMAHQIRTLSNAIIGFSELLGAENMDDGSREYVGEILQAGKALSILVNDVLDIAKLDSGKLKLNKTRCDLTERLSDFYQAIAPATKQKAISFSIVADADVPGRIFTDGERLIRCLNNLTTNAVKHTEKGHVRISISIIDKNNQPWFRFDIEDSGDGIHPERLAMIFDDIAMLENANRGVLNDMNMGVSITSSLPVTKRLITAMGGQIEATSTVGQGSTFSLFLPAGVDIKTEKKLNLSGSPWAEKATAKPVPSTATSKTSSNRKTNGHILLVEDMESNRVVITLLLEAIGLKVTSAKDGQEAVDKGLTETFDLILMDLMLPKVSGYEATRILREHNVRIPIIALTAGVMDEENTQSIGEQFDAMLSKPVDGKKLQETMRAYLPGFESSTSAPKTPHENDEFIIEYTR